MWKNKNFRVVTRILLISILFITTGYVLYQELFKEEKTIAAEVGNISPDFTLSDLDGKEHTLADNQGKGVVINFWATYCPPCEKEMPYLENAYQTYKDQGIEILAVNAAEPTILVNQYVSRKKLTFPILLDRNGQVLENYQVQNLPTTFFINAKGEVVKKVLGELSEEKLEEGLQLIK
ncbi:thiol-disulfide oxidoreductase ResA [Niallia oryzisoli]|uniref:Thiol-disulfide oxidoreductase ResA n=1 Tax=Niallia oryzisoli TaxID=1737571 RepID=A0ABZ2C8J3_9BACI